MKKLLISALIIMGFGLCAQSKVVEYNMSQVKADTLGLYLHDEAAKRSFGDAAACHEISSNCETTLYLINVCAATHPVKSAAIPTMTNMPPRVLTSFNQTGGEMYIF